MKKYRRKREKKKKKEEEKGYIAMERDVVFENNITGKMEKNGKEPLPFDAQQLCDVSFRSGFVASIPTISAISGRLSL